jgi:hypothetical protein
MAKKDLVSYGLRMSLIFGLTGLATYITLEKKGKPFKISEPWWPQIKLALNPNVAMDKPQEFNNSSNESVSHSIESNPLKREAIEGNIKSK